MTLLFSSSKSWWGNYVYGRVEGVEESVVKRHEKNSDDSIMLKDVGGKDEIGFLFLSLNLLRRNEFQGNSTQLRSRNLADW